MNVHNNKDQRTIELRPMTFIMRVCGTHKRVTALTKIASPSGHKSLRIVMWCDVCFHAKRLLFFSLSLFQLFPRRLSASSSTQLE